MRILISHPYYWPYVRRGAERYIHELSHYLSNQNYQVEIITSKPGQTKTISKGKITVCYWHQFQNPLLSRFGITPELSFMISAFYSFFQRKYDLIHTFHPADGFSAHHCKKFKSIRYVMNFNGVPIAAFFEKYPIYNHLMKKAFQSASAIIVNSNYAKHYLLKDYKKDGIVIPGAVDLSKFYITKEKDLDRPKVLCTCAIYEPYKNVAFLVKAFELFKTKVPKAILQLSGHVDYRTAQNLVSSVNSRIRSSIHIMKVGKVHDLPRLYSEAAFSVLPSINEAFGSVLIESLASGTPVVGTASGGIPEIINDPGIGVLYKPNKTDALPTNAGDLCDAMLQALELAKDPEIHYRCREHVKRYDWSILGSMFEEVYIKVLNGSI